MLWVNSMNTPRSSRKIPLRRQRGAALVVGMILLLVLTLLAVSGMNTASTELIMAGNEQYRENAFQAAEVGIEQALSNALFNPDKSTETYPLAPTQVPGAAVGDLFQTTITPQPDRNSPQPAMWGNSWNSFSTFHFEVRSQGSSATRRAVNVNTQGLFVLSPFDPGTPPPLSGVTGFTGP